MRPRIDAEVRHLLDAGESPRMIARRLDRRPDSVARALHRAGMTVEARRFWREADIDRGRIGVRP